MFRGVVLVGSSDTGLRVRSSSPGDPLPALNFSFGGAAALPVGASAVPGWACTQTSKPTASNSDEIATVTSERRVESSIHVTPSWAQEEHSSLFGLVALLPPECGESNHMTHRSVDPGRLRRQRKGTRESVYPACPVRLRA